MPVPPHRMPPPAIRLYRCSCVLFQARFSHGAWIRFSISSQPVAKPRRGETHTDIFTLVVPVLVSTLCVLISRDSEDLSTMCQSLTVITIMEDWKTQHFLPDSVTKAMFFCAVKTKQHPGERLVTLMRKTPVRCTSAMIIECAAISDETIDVCT